MSTMRPTLSSASKMLVFLQLSWTKYVKLATQHQPPFNLKHGQLLFKDETWWLLQILAVVKLVDFSFLRSCIYRLQRKIHLKAPLC